MSDIASVSQVLKATLSQESTVRRKAEDQLILLSKNSGLAEIFLLLIDNANISQDIRMASALALKNFSGEGEAPLEEEERSKIRDMVLRLMFDVPVVFRRQLSQTVCFIGKYDFPNKWQSLLAVLSECITLSDDFERLNAALSTLDELIRRYRYEMRSNNLFLEIITVMKILGEPLTQLYSKLLQYLPVKDVPDPMSYSQRQTWIELLYLIVKCYFSLISQDLPEYFEDNLAPWMTGFLQLLKANIPVLENEALNSEANVIDKLKGCICQIATLYSQRYEDCFEKFAESFIKAVWEVMVCVDETIRFDSLVNYSLGFLSAICQRLQYSKYFEDPSILSMICENIIVKNLMLRKDDLEMYNCEPFEFLKRDIEGNDLETRRRGASDFVKALCKFFEPQIFQILSTTISNFLSYYQQDPTYNFSNKDVVYYLVSAMATKTTTMKYGATSISELINISDFYKNYVRIDLLDSDINEFTILKTDALKYLILFRHQLNPEFLIESLCGIKQQGDSIIRLLGSKHILLHHYVAYTIERLLLVKTANNQPLFNSSNVPIGNIIESLFVCLNNQCAFETHYIMKALMRCFTIIDDSVAQNAHIFVGHFYQIIARAVENPIIPLNIHFIFECICVLIRKAYTKVEGGLDSHVIRIIELIIPRDIVDFVPYALQVTALLLDQSKAEREQGRNVSQDQYINFFQYLVKPDFWERLANVPALILVLESFIECFPQLILGQQYLSQILGIFQRLIASKAHDHHGFRLAQAMLLYIDTEITQLTSREIILPLLNRMQTLKTTKYAKNFVLFFFRFAFVKGGVSLVQSNFKALESIQPGVFLMVLEKIILVEMKNMPLNTTYEEKRIVSLGASSLISENVNQLGQFFSPLIDEAISILEVFERKNKENEDELATFEDHYTEANDLEYSDPYSKLSYAQHIDSVGKQITNVRKYLADAVILRAASINPESVNCLSSIARNTLQVYAKS